MKIDFEYIMQQIEKIPALEAEVSLLKNEVETLKSEILPKSDWVTITEAAKMLRVDYTTVHRYCKNGDLKKYRDPAGNPRLKRSEVENYYSRKMV